MLDQNGLTKLAEECAELIVIKEKIAGLGHLGNHWDGQNMLLALENEMADVFAAANHVIHRYELDVDRMLTRKEHKMRLFDYWQKGGTETELPKNFVSFLDEKCRYDELIIHALKCAHNIQKFLWGEDNWDLQDFDAKDWGGTFQKRVDAIKEVDRSNPSWKVNLKKRLLQQASLSIKAIIALEGQDRREHEQKETENGRGNGSGTGGDGGGSQRTETVEERSAGQGDEVGEFKVV